MNNFSFFVLKGIKYLHNCIFKNPKAGQGCLPDTVMDAEIASDIIYDLLVSDSPCMIARYGAFELSTVVNYLGIKNSEFSIKEYLKGNVPDPVWNKAWFYYMQNNAGFYPATEENIVKFCEMMINDTMEVDLLGSWSWNDLYMQPFYSKEMKSVHLILLEPFLNMNNPWTRALKGKRVLIVHPFNDLIEEQYKNKRTMLFSNPDLLPLFNLETIKAVQSIGGGNAEFKDWFEALEWMKREIDKREYDICLIGCGAYGFPLAAHCKRMGKKAIHLGGALQLFFGIKGKRWEDENYGVSFGVPQGYYVKLLSNEYWVRPGEENKPSNSKEVENGCYW